MTNKIINKSSEKKLTEQIEDNKQTQKPELTKKFDGLQVLRRFDQRRMQLLRLSEDSDVKI
jgi:hypothetical protein